MKLTLTNPNFKHEWRDALRFREFEKMGEEAWTKHAKDNSEVVDYDTIKDKLGNVNLDFDSLNDEKRGHFKKHIKDGKMEMPIAVKFNDNDYKLIGGNTRLAGLLNKKGNPKIWVVDINSSETEVQEIDGGLADKCTVEDIAKKHKVSVSKIKKQLEKGIKVEMEHTDDKSVAREIAMDHLFEDPDYYDKLHKMETDEQTMSGSSGSFEGAMSGSGSPIKKPITTIHNSETELDEVTSTATSAGGQYDAPAFVQTDNDPLSIGGEKSIKQSKAVSDPNFPKLGGPGGKFVNEVADTSISAGAQFDVPYGGGTKGRKDPLSIGGEKSIKQSKAVSDPNFPKFGGPGGVYIKIKDKCKKFPYCNQGDINAIEVLHESINEVAEKHDIPTEKVEKIVLKEIRKIFIKHGNK